MSDSLSNPMRAALARLPRLVVVLVAATAAVLFWSFGALYLLGSPAETAEKVIAGETCTTTLCGPVRVVDCGSGHDGPLVVFSRFPERALADCGFWSRPSAFCAGMDAIMSFCPQARSNYATDR